MQSCKTRQIVAAALTLASAVFAPASHAQQYQQRTATPGYYQGQAPGGIRALLPASRGYDVQQGQQAASWYYSQPQQRTANKSSKSAPSKKAAPKTSTPKETARKTEPSAATAAKTQRLAPKKQVSSSANWYTSFDSAWKKACDQGRPLVVLFVHHGCPECDKMDYYLAQPGSAASLASAVKVRIEFTQNPEVVNRFGVKLTPTFLVMSPDGGEAYREVGALTPERLKQIQPALESLVTGPPEKETSLKAKDSTISPQDHNTSQTVAAL